MNKTKNKTIIYVNFSPYENAGRILDYLLENFENVLLFSFNFHKLGKGQEPSKLKVFKKGKLKKEYPLYQTSTPVPFTFLFLPLRSFIIFLQILWYTLRLRKNYGNYDIYFTVNAFTAWTGNILKKLGFVEKTIFWVWDYYPPLHENKIIMFMRWLYWQFDKAGTFSDRVVFLNKRLQDLRKHIGILPKSANYPIVPIGIDRIKINKIKNRQNKKTITLGFIGVLKKSQGLDLIFDHANEIHKAFPTIKLEIIGAGPDETYFKKKANKSPVPVTFYGFLQVSGKKAREIIPKFDIGIAPYIPEESNVSYYGDPSKIKDYLSFGIPTITTGVFVFSEKLKKEKAGIIINYFKSKEFTNAISEIISRHRQFQQNAIKLARQYYYKDIYRKMFEF